MKTMRKRFSNGVIVGVRRGEWWFGARDDFACDAVVFGLVGLTLMVPHEVLPPVTARRLGVAVAVAVPVAWSGLMVTLGAVIW